MSTRSYIGMLQADGTVSFIYCHTDGSPAGVGALLTQYWTQAGDVAALIALGDLSELGTVLGTEQDFNAPVAGWCLAYGRDRGELGTEAGTAGDTEHYFLLSGDPDIEWIYLWRDGIWFVSTAAPHHTWGPARWVAIGTVPASVPPLLQASMFA